MFLRVKVYSEQSIRWLEEALTKVEPAANVRRWKREKARSREYSHVFAIDGLITNVPFEGGFSDVTMAGHVVDDDLESEIRELYRVTGIG